jgi:signal transduction histidine kinase
LNSRSLRLRLLAGAIIWIILALLIAGTSIGYLFVDSIERSQQRYLEATFGRVVALIDDEAVTPILSAPLTDPRFETPFSGLYWQIEDVETNEIGRSRSLWDYTLTFTQTLSDAGGGEFVVVPGPSGQSLSALVRDVSFTEGGLRTLRVIIAEDRAVLDAAIARFGRELTIALALLAIALVAAVWLQVRLGLRPLDELRAGIEAIRRGESDTLPGNFPSEVLPLTAEVNELLQSQQASIEFARARASDLAHGLKTPLAVLATVSEDLRDKNPESAEQIERLTSEMTDRVDYQLRLSRLRLRTRAYTLTASLNDALDRIVAVLRRTHEGERLEWVIENSERLSVDIDEHDLIELMGVVLENAAKWARSQVEVRTGTIGASAEVTVGDDGPGLTKDQIAALGVRGRRLDETKMGAGLGLSIAGEIVSLNNGTLEFGRSKLGGLLVTLRLPLSA